MRDELDRPLPVELLGSIDTHPQLVLGSAAEQWSRSTTCVLATLDGEFVAFDRASLLAGKPTPVDRWPREPGAMAALTPTGTTLIVAGAESIRAMSGDRILWEHRHARWAVQGVRGPGLSPALGAPPAVSPDGTQVSVLVAGASTRSDDRTVWSTWLLLDTVTGDVLAEHRLGFPTLEVTQRWHSDSRHLTVSRWIDWESWVTLYVDLTEQPLRTRWIRNMREITDLLTPTRLLSLRRAEYIAGTDDDRADVGIHQLIGSQECELARLDVLHLGGGFNEEPHDVRKLGVDHVLFSPGACHLLLGAEHLRPLGRLDYPDDRVGPHIAPLPAGTWLTVDVNEGGMSRLRHWRLA
ncbi:hypothetical protein [Nonomuraea sp. LPB2021202275-12-8]|uniref:hypothetical protein n=1 Tax=Nonomuraea sp. LPB2021202275-12-8 TaxID=3120159 RepID=UPI00300C37AA